MPNCTLSKTHVGQMRRTGNRLAMRLGAVGPEAVFISAKEAGDCREDVLAFMKASPDQASSVRLEKSGGGLLLAQMQQVEAVFFHGDEPRR